MTAATRCKPPVPVAVSDELAEEGLSPQDRERAASLADEGGAAAAVIEAGERKLATPRRESGRKRLLVTLVMLGVMGVWLISWINRSAENADEET